MGRFILGFFFGAVIALTSSPYIFPYGVQAAAQHWVQDLRDGLPVVKAYFATP